MNPDMNSVDGSNKRKRETPDNAGDAQRITRPAPTHNGGLQGLQGGMQGSPSGGQQQYYSAAEHSMSGYETHGLSGSGPELSQIDQQLLQHVGGAQNGVNDDNAMTAKAALAAHQPQSKYPPPDTSFDNGGLGHNLTFGEDVNQVPMPAVHNQPVHNHSSTAAAVYAAREAQNMGQKPPVGSPEWHTIRKNNHKEGKVISHFATMFLYPNYHCHPVERRRRETINEGINEIAKIVPGCEKAKGSILQRAIQYIGTLQAEHKAMSSRCEAINMTTNHAITEISAQNTKLKGEVNRRGDVALKWIQRCREAGLEFDDYEDEKDLGPIEVEELQVQAQAQAQIQAQMQAQQIHSHGHDHTHTHTQG